MSHLVSRILLAMFMLPLAAVVFVLTIITAENYLRSMQFGPSYQPRETVMFMMAGAATWAFVSVYWFLLWQKSVVWTGSRRLRTLGVAAGLLVASLILFSVAYLSTDSFAIGCMVFGTVLVPLLWLISTVFIWRETALERGERLRRAGRSGVACPTCGYNLTGLNESRCPECGSRFTLDELLAAQPATAGGEIE